MLCCSGLELHSVACAVDSLVLFAYVGQLCMYCFCFCGLVCFERCVIMRLWNYELKNNKTENKYLREDERKTVVDFKNRRRRRGRP